MLFSQVGSGFKRLWEWKWGYVVLYVASSISCGVMAVGPYRDQTTRGGGNSFVFI